MTSADPQTSSALETFALYELDRARKRVQRYERAVVWRVREARRQGVSWARIAQVLGLTPEGARRRYARHGLG